MKVKVKLSWFGLIITALLWLQNSFHALVFLIQTAKRGVVLPSQLNIVLISIDRSHPGVAVVLYCFKDLKRTWLNRTQFQFRINTAYVGRMMKPLALKMKSDFGRNFMPPTPTLFYYVHLNGSRSRIIKLCFCLSQSLKYNEIRCECGNIAWLCVSSTATHKKMRKRW